MSLDADLQDDIEAIPRMLEEHRKCAEMVYGVRHKRACDTFFKRFTAQNYYKLLNAFGVDILPGHADFRLVSRKTIEALKKFNEVNLFLRGIIPLLGFRRAIVEYQRAARFAGVSKYPLAKMLAFAFDGSTSFSAVPLQWSTHRRSARVRLAVLRRVGRVRASSTDLTVPGCASTVVPMYCLGGIQLLFLGVIGGYISKTYAETKRRPRFIIERTLRRCRSKARTLPHRPRADRSRAAVLSSTDCRACFSS
ncbi:hypothetical protein [Caballeronia grimmiae]|uniref:hypothetical protein n=1 Tax=Caballeronia grimmiae TaxID=1071679 RepID=UPI0038BCEB27